MQVFSTQRRPNREHQSHNKASLTSMCVCRNMEMNFRPPCLTLYMRCDQELMSVNISGHRGGLDWPSSGLLQTSHMHDEISSHLCYAVRMQCKHWKGCGLLNLYHTALYIYSSSPQTEESIPYFYFSGGAHHFLPGLLRKLSALHHFNYNPTGPNTTVL